MTQQTAVEWFAFQIMNSWNDIQNGKTSIDEFIEQAKQMEKEQIIKSHCDGFYKSAEGWNGEYGLNDIDKICEEIKAEQYYNETYNK